MQQRVRKFPNFTAALAVAYEEEASGVAYWEALAEQHEGRQREALELLVRLHLLTVAALEPLVTKHQCSAFTPHGMQTQGRREASTRQSLPWASLVDRIRAEHPAFVLEFKDIEAMSPPDDRAVLSLLVGAEEAIVEFAQRESMGDASSLEPLHHIIARFESR